MVLSLQHDAAADVALGIAGPVLDVLETGLELVPVPGLGLVPKSLSAILDVVKVRQLLYQNLHAY